MKKCFRTLLLTAALALMLCTAAMAADSTVLVQLNGQPLALSEAPQIVSGRAFLPFRSVFTALGFSDEDISFQAETRQISAVNGQLTVSMVLGENRITVVRDGERSVIETDAAAFIDPEQNRAYVPARFVAEAAGLRLGWDSRTSTVILDDVDAILAANQEKYTVLDRHLDFSRRFMTQNYQVDGSYSAVIRLTGSLNDPSDRMNMNGQYSMLMSGSAAFDFDANLSFSGSIDDQDLSALMPGGLDLSLRGNLEEGRFYFKSDSLMSSAGLGVENLWFQLELAQMIDRAGLEEGLSYAQLLTLSRQAADMSGAEYAEYLVRAMARTDSSRSAGTILAQFNDLLGDSAFTQSGSSYLSRCESENAVIEITLPTSAGKVSGCTVTAAYTAEETALSMTVSQTEKQMKAGLDIRDAEISVNMEMDGNYTATSSTPAGAPPEGAAVLDLSQSPLY